MSKWSLGFGTLWLTRSSDHSHTLKKILPGILGSPGCCLDLPWGISLHISGDLWVNLIYLVGRWDEKEREKAGSRQITALGRVGQNLAWQLLKVSSTRVPGDQTILRKRKPTSFLKQRQSVWVQQGASIFYGLTKMCVPLDLSFQLRTDWLGKERKWGVSHIRFKFRQQNNEEAMKWIN